jgi:hypothetical protein
VVAPSTRVNLALPFSKIQTAEPSKELSELAALVEELADVVRGLAAGPEADRICDRASALAARLR